MIATVDRADRVRFRIVKHTVASLIAALLLGSCAPSSPPSSAHESLGTQVIGAGQASGSPVSNADASDGPITPTASDDQDADVAVSIVDFAFKPPSVVIRRGGTVAWTNYGSIAFSGLRMGNADHAVMFDELGLGSQLLGHMTTYAIHFDKPGTYAYDCPIHPSMHGTVIVSP
jgi:plastocyanin